MIGQAPDPIVILGGGFGGAYCAQALEARLGEQASRVVLLDRRNYFIFYPLLIEAGTGELEPRHAVVALRSFLRRTRFVMCEVRDIDLAGNQLVYQLAGENGERRMRYAHLVIALGSITKIPPVPGLREHGFELKSLADAVGLRDRAIELLERADAIDDPDARRTLLHLVVVGGNFTGVEVAGEMQVLLAEASRRYRNIRPEDCRVTLIEIQDRILPALDQELADYAARQMRNRGTDIRLGASVQRVEADHVILSDASRIDTMTTIWCAGIAPPPLVERLKLPVDPRGYILCEADLRVKGTANVWSVGDCAVIPNPAGGSYPATAQHAIQEGHHAAANIVALERGDPTQPFRYVSRGTLAGLGGRVGVARLGRWNITGFPAWFLWRTVYLLKMPGLARRIRVALDWTLQLVFGREHVQLGVHHLRQRTEPPAPHQHEHETLRPDPAATPRR